MNPRIFNFMKESIEELKYVKKEVSKTDKNIETYSPFYSSINVKDPLEYQLKIVNGGIYFLQDKKNFPIKGQIGIRMGHPKKGGAKEYTGFTLPRNLEKMACDISFKDAAKEAFWECARDLGKRFNKNVGTKFDRGNYLYFSQEKPANYLEKLTIPDVDFMNIAENMKRISLEFNKESIDENQIELNFYSSNNYFLDSEGSKIFTSEHFFDLILNFFKKNKEGLMIPYQEKIRSIDFPSNESILKKGKMAINNLKSIVKSKQQVNGSFPTILCSENTGVVWHEVVGHGLEGHRQQSKGEEETNLFKDRMGDKITKSFVNLYDDPTINEFNNEKVMGSYEYDDEGVKSKRVDLIKNGTLTDLLHSRESAGYMKKNSNGHSRYAFNGVYPPHPRMGVLVVESNHPVSFENLKEGLMKECEKQNKPYGLYIKGKGSGWVMPGEAVYSTYAPEAFRIYKDGKIERVNGISVIGTPHASLNNLIAMSGDKKLENGFCGAESGLISHGIIAPESLFSNIEVNRIPKDMYKKCYEDIFKK